MRAALFLDLDGTLFDLVDRPDAVRADRETRSLLAALNRMLAGRLAIVSGRSIGQVDEILGPCAADIAVSGSHGCEHRWKGLHAHPVRPAELDLVAERFRDFAKDRPGVLVEVKSFGVALHYRTAPDAAASAASLARALTDSLGLHLQEGKMMVELRVADGDKGAAVRRFMARPEMAGTAPVFAGDDLTDEPAFAAVRALGGHGILIGEPRPTAADFALPSPEALRNWLQGALR